MAISVKTSVCDIYKDKGLPDQGQLGAAGLIPCGPGDSASPHFPQVCEGAGRRGCQSYPRAAGSACGLWVCLGGGLCSPFPLKVLFPWGTLSRAWPKNPGLPTQTAAILPCPSLSILLHSSPPNPQASSFFQQQLHLRGPYLLLFRDNQLAEAVAPILWPPDVKSRLTGRDPDAGKDWGQEEKRMTKDEMVGWHHQLNGHEFEQSWRWGSLASCSPLGGKEPNMT